MAIPIIMPRQGQSVETCILTSLLKSPGDQVKKGEILFEYETDKASFEEEASEDGVFLGAFFEEGDEVPVLKTVCVIGREGEDISQFSQDNKYPTFTDSHESDETVNFEAPKETRQTALSTKNSEHYIRISPRARKKAEIKNVPINELSGTGPNGRILNRDVEQWLQTKKSSSSAKATPKREKIQAQPPSEWATTTTLLSKEDYEIKPLTNIRKIIARAMHQSLQSSAQLTHHLSADARGLLAVRKQAKKENVDLTLNDLICYATVKALKKFPQVNAHLSNEQLRLYKGVHLGIAVDTERGLMVPTVKNADDLNIHGLSSKMHELASACRKGSIDPGLIAPEAASFTISNLGNYGVEMFTPVINLPQVAILGVNTIIYRPRPMDDGSMAIIPHLGLSLTYDHRALDGSEATRFVKEVANEIEALTPSQILG
ncbi:dihydrolipoamide acetyltransferase family protein [Marinilabilia salmonicolor]|uniref:Dihydrolipoamide acetyltransferase component of pyruvate dehydrogenase complex n=1 Tax=Marinilabilia salmonicolor TaxID=989 RepID=A0A368UUI6_9BACT|nr:dihydrolipoamide acetyltransferase family protein [Marinilabilia salmonicolor]RCW32527.1 pyruvate dehydrogenase E2 component (dihydrolipoamide acetyltransferase) [Marinilabilia salmonicolor]